MNMSKVVIELEFEHDDFNADPNTLKEAVYDYLQELMSDGSLCYTIEE